MTDKIKKDWNSWIEDFKNIKKHANNLAIKKYNTKTFNRALKSYSANITGATGNQKIARIKHPSINLSSSISNFFSFDDVKKYYKNKHSDLENKSYLYFIPLVVYNPKFINSNEIEKNTLDKKDYVVIRILRIFKSFNIKKKGQYKHTNTLK